jgi:hypothetical protein
MKIAILGWGSLVWDWGDLRIVDDAWHKNGPTLPIELSRLSKKRGYLTYVIDDCHERRVPTRFAISKYMQIEDAIADLACREGCAAKSVGYVRSEESSRRRARKGVPWRDIQKWVQEQKLDAAIWTDLPRTLPCETTPEDLVDYFKILLAKLPADKAEQAKEYARRAPEEVDTDLRRRLNAENLLTSAKPD